MAEPDDLVVAVQQLSVIQNRFDTAHSDPTGDGAGDDGSTADLNHPIY